MLFLQNNWQNQLDRDYFSSLQEQSIIHILIKKKKTKSRRWRTTLHTKKDNILLFFFISTANSVFYNAHYRQNWEAVLPIPACWQGRCSSTGQISREDYAQGDALYQQPMDVRQTHSTAELHRGSGHYCQISTGKWTYHLLLRLEVLILKAWKKFFAHLMYVLKLFIELKMVFFIISCTVQYWMTSLRKGMFHCHFHLL